MTVPCLTLFSDVWTRRLLLILLAGAPLQMLAQIKVQAGFLADSIRIGEQAPFYLSASYPSGTTILFPDSSFNFSDFEYARRKYFPTETHNGISTDSTIYYLTTFELGPALTLKLPAYAVAVRDCTVYYSNTDSLHIIQLVADVPDSVAVDALPLRETTAYFPVHRQFNFFIMAIVVVAVALVAVAVWLIFGRRIGRYLVARRLQRRHIRFRGDFNSLVRELQATFSRAGAESAISLWKKYMEDLEARPYTKMTSRETINVLRDEALGINLRAIDRAIYGNDNRIVEPLQQLGTIADQHFNRKLQEVRDGK